MAQLSGRKVIRAGHAPSYFREESGLHHTKILFSAASMWSANQMFSVVSSSEFWPHLLSLLSSFSVPASVASVFRNRLYSVPFRYYVHYDLVYMVYFLATFCAVQFAWKQSVARSMLNSNRSQSIPFFISIIACTVTRSALITRNNFDMTDIAQLRVRQYVWANRRLPNFVNTPLEVTGSYSTFLSYDYTFHFSFVCNWLVRVDYYTVS